MARRIRVVALIACWVGGIWLIGASLRFRQALRTNLQETYHDWRPLEANDTSKIINSYYEALYRDLPHTVLPAILVILGATVLFLMPKSQPA
jgi:hypothetical protein